MRRRWSRGICVVALGAVGAAGLVTPEGAHASTVSVSVGDSSVVEGQATHRYVKFPITLSAPAPGPVTVTYSTHDGSAIAGPDYRAHSGSVTFAPGQTSKGVAVTVWPNRITDGDRSFSFHLDTVAGAVTDRVSGTGTIIDDDPNAGPRVGIGDVTVPATCTTTAKPTLAPVEVTLSTGLSAPVVVHVATADDSAHSGTDYTAISTDRTITASKILTEIRVPVLAAPRPTTVAATISVSVVSGSIGVQRATGTITMLGCNPGS